MGIAYDTKITLLGTALFLLATGCSPLPRIIMLHDPLSAGEHITLGFSYEQRGEYDYALQEYSKAIKRDKRDYRPLFYMGNIYYKKGEYELAKKYYNKALRIVRDNGDIHNNLAWVYMDTGRLEEAREEIDRALSIKRDPYYMDTQANVYAKMGRYEEAVVVIEEAIHMTSPADTDLLYNEYKLLGDLYERLGNDDLAREARKKGEEYRRDIQ